jgi:predicted metal-dependent hydrolase
MKTIRLDGETPVDIRLRRSTRARRLSLRVSSLDGAVTMTVPSRLPVAEAIAFAGDRREWILKARAQSRCSVAVGEGASLPVEGEVCQVVADRVRAPRLERGVLTVPVRAPGRSAAAFLKCLARDRLAAACDDRAGTLGVSYSSIALRDTRSRWGSCSHAGRLMFSWRLAMAPPEVLDYVAAHEVAHLVHMDHSPAFWRVVESLVPGWRQHRRWLHLHGGDLHAYRFED